MRKFTPVSIKEVVGPFPGNNKCVIVIGNDKKNVGIPISSSEAECCRQVIDTNHSPYTYTANILSALDVQVTLSSLFISNGEFYSLICLKQGNQDKPLKLSFDSASQAVSTSLANDIQLSIDEEDFNRLKDCSTTYSGIKGKLTYPMPQLNDTNSLQSACEFIDEVFDE